MRLNYAFVFAFSTSAVPLCTVRDVSMEIVDELAALLARERFITWAAPELSVILDISVLRAEVTKKYGAPQRRAAMLLGMAGRRRLLSSNTFGSFRQDADAAERLGCIENVAHRKSMLRMEEQRGNRSTDSHRGPRCAGVVEEVARNRRVAIAARVQRSLTPSRTKQSYRVV